MARGPEITDEVKMLIAALHKEHPKWTNKMIRNEVSSIVSQRDSSLPKGWPSKFAIDRIMPGVRERERRRKSKPDPIDQPWTVQSMSNSKYYIPPEALPSVLHAWFLATHKGYQLSIRDARWVGRLHAAVRDIETLLYYSGLASMAEMLAEMAGIEDFVGYDAVNLFVFSTMTDHAITTEEAKTVAGISEEIRPKTVDAFSWVQGIFEAKGYLSMLGIIGKALGEARPKRNGGKK